MKILYLFNILCSSERILKDTTYSKMSSLTLKRTGEPDVENLLFTLFRFLVHNLSSILK